MPFQNVAFVRPVLHRSSKHSSYLLYHSLLLTSLKKNRSFPLKSFQFSTVNDAFRPIIKPLKALFAQPPIKPIAKKEILLNIYQKELRQCYSEKKYEQVWRTYCLAYESRQLDSLSRLDLRTIFHSLKESHSPTAWAKALRVINETTNSKNKPSSSEYNWLLYFLGRYKKWDLLIKTYEEMLTLKIPTTTITYDHILYALGLKQDFKGVIEYYDKMIMEGHEPSTHTYTIVMNIFGHAGDTERVARIFERMLSDGVKPNVVTFTTIINAYINSGDFSAAEDFFRKMKSFGVRPSTQTYSSLIISTVKRGDMELALSFYHEMRADRVNGSPGIFAALAKGFSNIDNVEGVKDMYTKIHESIVRTKEIPDIWIFSYLIKWFSNRMDLNMAMTVFKDMIDLGIEPNRFVYTALMDSYFRVNNAQVADEIFCNMDASKITPDVYTFNTIISGMFRTESSAKVYRIFEKMISLGLTPNEVTFSILYFGFINQYDYHSAYSVLERMLADGYKPTIEYFTSLICISKKIPEAELAYKKMVALGLTPDTTIYSTLIHVYSREGHIHQATKMYMTMKARGLEPNVVTYTSLLKAYCAKGEMVQAKDIYNHMKSKGIIPDGHVYSLLMKSFGYYGDLQAAIEVYEEIKSCDYRADAYAFTSLINAYVENGDGEGAYKLYQEMVDQKVTPTPATLGVLLKLDRQNEKDGDFLSVWNRLLKDGVQPNSRNACQLLKYKQVANNLSTAKDVWRHIQECGLGNNVYVRKTYIEILHAHHDIEGIEEILNSMETKANTSHSLPKLKQISH
ncbi:hypothetical protein K7432_002836 [Basidiobolus ranarum]|uniref:PROP1-like PPR domain-containing protein n=1 Tax=Basidiobolus ranarum TaxID=34480 RepID=A0ABR2W7G9_9FUNG